MNLKVKDAYVDEKFNLNSVKAFAKLIKTYEGISLSTLQQCWEECPKDSRKIAQILTGFGNCSTCSLCTAIKHDEQGFTCVPCFWTVATTSRCAGSLNVKTWSAINDAESYENQWRAFQERAKYMKRVLRKVFKPETVKELLEQK